MKEAWTQAHASHSTYQSLARAADCGRVPIKIICRCLHAPDINIPHLAEDGSECVHAADEPSDEELTLHDTSSDEEASSNSASARDAASELNEEIDSDYEAEDAILQLPPPPAPAPRGAKRKLGE